jgi:hypothetical protein
LVSKKQFGDKSFSLDDTAGLLGAVILLSGRQKSYSKRENAVKRWKNGRGLIRMDDLWIINP